MLLPDLMLCIVISKKMYRQTQQKRLCNVYHEALIFVSHDLYEARLICIFHDSGHPPPI